MKYTNTTNEKNTKNEILNPKQIRMLKILNPKRFVFHI